MATTKYTDLNLTMSVGKLFADNLTAAGWKVYWQASSIYSGTATQGEVTLVAEFPAEPNILVLPTKPTLQARTQEKVIIPAFSVAVIDQPVEEIRAGIGETIFQQRATIEVEGWVSDRAEHMAFGTSLREWFSDGTAVPLFDYELNNSNPPLVTDADIYIEARAVTRDVLVAPNIPAVQRYYLDMQADIVFYD